MLRAWHDRRGHVDALRDERDREQRRRGQRDAHERGLEDAPGPPGSRVDLGLGEPVGGPFAQRRKSEKKPCLVVARIMSARDVVSGISFGQTSTQTCALP